MERAVAVKKLGKLLGKSFGYRVNERAATAEERAAARAELSVAVAEQNLLRHQQDERRKAVLAADQEYQGLRDAASKASKRVDELSSVLRSYKFKVGVSNSMFFHLKAQGDSWEEVIRKVSDGRQP